MVSQVEKGSIVMKKKENSILYSWSVFCCPTPACSKLTKRRVTRLKNRFLYAYLPILTTIIACFSRV